MAKDKGAKPSISDTIKEALKGETLPPADAGGETTGNTGGQPEGDADMAKAATWGDFKVEVGVVPEPRGGASREKYDWASFPAPKDPKDKATWPSVVIPGVKNTKTISKSISRFREKLQEENKTAKVKATVPEFDLFSVKNDKKETIDIRVVRKV